MPSTHFKFNLPSNELTFLTQMPAQFFLCAHELSMKSIVQGVSHAREPVISDHPHGPEQSLSGSRWTGHKISIGPQRELHLSENETCTCCLSLMALITEASLTHFQAWEHHDTLGSLALPTEIRGIREKRYRVLCAPGEALTFLPSISNLLVFIRTRTPWQRVPLIPLSQ